MIFFSYVVDRDFGFAPNPFFGFCTLANCKPRTRATAQIGDIIFGLAGTNYREPNSKKLIYAMQVTEILSFNEYFKDSRFEFKKPIINATPKRQYGDNIYYKDENNNYKQIDSHHSLKSGIQHRENTFHDTKVDKVLISDNFIYFGNNPIDIPLHLYSNSDAHRNISIKRNHKNRFHQDFKENLKSYWESLPRGIKGNPNEWN